MRDLRGDGDNRTRTRLSSEIPHHNIIRKGGKTDEKQENRHGNKTAKKSLHTHSIGYFRLKNLEVLAGLSPVNH
jgi:hypothetical protein